MIQEKEGVDKVREEEQQIEVHLRRGQKDKQQSVRLRGLFYIR